ncbi:PPOX class F420-dependent oxidoreductase [Lapillicoccus jejuensis]|uniref:PPOX class probable F420-dependent enzyme n=1 Tax=Lapillicoccus jejuensis TaxID=402171 RepID=A0A542E0K9_9MICO|nr:PPOX class F420-dependent oxidoreductase [Lapillicoccus jejuensis]TQJ08880.1 PPOX class probable F420-dependent enzyme [Lapillicoccus jejuensis]
MTTTLPEPARAVLDAPEQITVATIEPDGRPQLSPVWAKRDGDDILFSTVRGRRKTDNLERDPRVSVVVWPKDDPYSYLEVRGTATVTDDPGGSLIQELSRKYTGGPYTADAPDTPRVVVRITPDKVHWRG